VAVLPLALLMPELEQTPVFRVAVEAVRVDVFVGRKGNPVAGLQRTDFELLDDGVRQEIEIVDVDAFPLSVALVLDTSTSMVGKKLGHLRSAALGFLGGLSAEDRASIITFSHWIHRRGLPTVDRRPLERSLDILKAYGATSWHDALFVGLKTVEEEPFRQMVVLFTDGEDTYSWLREEQMRPLVRQSNAVVYAIAKKGREGGGSGGDHQTLQRNREQARRRHARRTRLLRELTGESGGRLLETETPEELRETFLSILSEMNMRYVLTYVPRGATEEGWHRLEVKVRSRGAEVHARRGYFYEVGRE
jgi:VWFA-related protein